MDGTSNDRNLWVRHEVLVIGARTQCWIYEIHSWEHGDDPIALTVARLRELGVRRGSRVGLEMDNWYLKASTYRALVQALPEVKFVDLTSAVTRLRTIKSPAEIELMRRAAEFSDIGLKAAIDTLRPGVRETDLLAAGQSAMTTVGSEYPTLLLTPAENGANSAN